MGIDGDGDRSGSISRGIDWDGDRWGSVSSGIDGDGIDGNEFRGEIAWKPNQPFRSLVDMRVYRDPIIIFADAFHLLGF